MKMLSINQVFLFFSLFSSKNMVISNPHSLRMWKSSCAYLDLNFQWLARPFCPFGILVLASSGVQMVTEAGSKHSPRPHPLPTSTAQSLHSQDVTPILWPCDARNWLIGKDPDAGKDWGQGFCDPGIFCLLHCSFPVSTLVLSPFFSPSFLFEYGFTH